MKCLRTKAGFSLPEVLVVLLLVGQIATYTIPKVLISVQDQHKKAVFKETISTVSQVLYEGMLTGELDRQENLNPFLQRKLNTLQVCQHGHADGCYTETGPPGGGSGSNDDGGLYILPNGAYIIDVEHLTGDCTSTFCFDVFAIDWNGTRPPNEFGKDILRITFSYGADPVSHTDAQYNNLKPGGFRSLAADEELFRWIFN